jgi:hypothetical protein
MNGECFVICGFYKYTLLASTDFNLTVPWIMALVCKNDMTQLTPQNILG